MKKRPTGVESGERLNSKSYNQYSEGLQIGGAGNACKFMEKAGDIFIFGRSERGLVPIWAYEPASGNAGLLASYEGRDKTVPQVLQSVSSTWTTAAFGPYISSTITTMNPGGISKRVDQALDGWGNLTSMTLYNFNGTVRRTYANTYLAYGAYHIWDRLASSTVTEVGTTTTLVNNSYDWDINTMPTLSSPRQFDASYTTAVTHRGNLTSTQQLSAPQTFFQHDNAGNLISTTVGGFTVTRTTFDGFGRPYKAETSPGSFVLTVGRLGDDHDEQHRVAGGYSLCPRRRHAAGEGDSNFATSCLRRDRVLDHEGCLEVSVKPGLTPSWACLFC